MSDSFPVDEDQTMSPAGPRRSSQLKIDIEGLPEGKSHVNVMCFDLGLNFCLLFCEIRTKSYSDFKRWAYALFCPVQRVAIKETSESLNSTKS